MMGEQQEQAGGIHWELSEALNLIEAGRAAQDWQMERLGWVRLSQALVNAAGSGSAKQLAPVLRQAANERKEDAASTAHLVMLLLDQTEKEHGELGRQAARLGLVEAAEHEHIPPWILRRILRHLSRSILLLMERERKLEGQFAEDGESTRDMIEYLDERASHEAPETPPAWVHPDQEEKV